MKENRFMRTKAIFLSAFFHSSLLLAIGMAGYQVAKQPYSELELSTGSNNINTQEVEIINQGIETSVPPVEKAAKPSVTVKSESEQTNTTKVSEGEEPITLPVKKSDKMVSKKETTPPRALPTKNEVSAQDIPVEQVVENPVVVPQKAEVLDGEPSSEVAATSDSNESVGSEDMSSDELAKSAAVESSTSETQQAPADVQAIAPESQPTPKEQDSDPEEKIAETQTTEGGLPQEAVAEEDENWADEIRSAALPFAQASEPTSNSKGSALGTNPTAAGGPVRSESELTPKSGNPQAIYPPVARLNRIEGTSIVRFKVSDSGLVTEAWLQRSSGFKPIDDEALRTQKNWKYAPGKSGTFQKSWVFRLKGDPEVLPYKIRR